MVRLFCVPHFGTDSAPHKTTQHTTLTQSFSPHLKTAFHLFAVTRNKNEIKETVTMHEWISPDRHTPTDTRAAAITDADCDRLKDFTGWITKQSSRCPTFIPIKTVGIVQQCVRGKQMHLTITTKIAI